MFVAIQARTVNWINLRFATIYKFVSFAVVFVNSGFETWHHARSHKHILCRDWPHCKLSFAKRCVSAKQLHSRVSNPVESSWLNLYLANLENTFSLKWNISANARAHISLQRTIAFYIWQNRLRHDTKTSFGILIRFPHCWSMVMPHIEHFTSIFVRVEIFDLFKMIFFCILNNPKGLSNISQFFFFKKKWRLKTSDFHHHIECWSQGQPVRQTMQLIRNGRQSSHFIDYGPRHVSIRFIYIQTRIRYEGKHSNADVATYYYWDRTWIMHSACTL